VSHARALFALLDESRSELRKWLPFIDATTSVPDIETFIRSGLTRFANGNGPELGIWYRGALVGVIGVHYIDWTHRITSIGYWLGTPHLGKGIMTRSCHALTDMLITEYQLNRVEIQVATENYRSRRIPERLGFLQEGTRRQAEWLYDHFVDHVIYAMLAGSWPASK
jgi:ribosomal-protein-serine acetyltransferase